MLFMTRPFSAAGYSARILSDGAAGFWRLGEASGTVLVDEAGINNGIYQGNFTLGQAGIAGAGGNTAVLFSGLNSAKSQVSPTQANIDFNQAFTLECWIKTTNNTQDAMVFGSWTGGANLGHGLGVLNNSITVFSDGVSPLSFLNSGVFNGAFHHLVVAYSAAPTPLFADLYVDGVYSGTGNAGGVSITSKLTFGSYDNINAYFDGVLDECAIYPTILSAATILDHYNLGIA